MNQRSFQLPLLIVLCVCVYAAPLFSQEAENENAFDPNKERRGAHFEIDDIGRLILGFRNQAYEDIAEELFDRVSTFDVGVPISDITTLIGQLRRKVYDNRDGTYTVLDIFGVKGVVAPAETKDVAGVPVYGVVGSEVGADFVNIRQYDHKLKIGYAPSIILPDDPWFQDLWNGVKGQWFGLKPLFDLANGTLNLVTGFFRSPSGEFMPRYENILDLISTPFRLPLSVRGFVQMDPGEIYSYTITGGFFTSVGTGYVSGNLSANIGLNMFIRGAARVTVLKERDGNFAKIRRSMVRSHGHSVSAKVKQAWELEGILFGTDASFSITPFKLAIGEDNIRQWDQVFRYDMQTIEGRYAYQKAVKGNFIPSELFAAMNVGVQWEYDKTVKTKQHHFLNHYNLIVWRHQKDLPWGDSLITIQDKQGTSHVFRSVSRNEIESGNLFRSGDERFDYFIETVMELDDPNASTLSIDPMVQIVMFASDRHSYGYELRKNLQMVEEIIGKGLFFDEGRYDPRRDYGKTELQLHIRFNLEAVDQILSVQQEDLWRALAKAHGIRPSEWESPEKREKWTNWITWIFALRSKKAQDRIRIMKEAQETLGHFLRIKQEEDRKKRASLLSEFHHDSAFQWKYLTAMLHLADEKNIYYRVSFQGGKVEGKEEEWGDVLEVTRPDLHEKDDEAFEGRENLDRSDIKNLVLLRPEGENQFILQFETDAAANNEIEGFWFLINHIHFKWVRGSLLYQTPDDRNLFKRFEVGENGIVKVFLNELECQFQEGETYEISFAFRGKNKVFSIQPTVKFKYEKKAELDMDWIDIRGKSEFKN